MGHKPLSVSAFAKLWTCDAEFTPVEGSKHSVHVWEPLDTVAPEDARPYVNGSGEIAFYDRTGNKVIEYRVRCHDFGGTYPNLILLGGDVWREIFPGSVVRRDGRWVIRRHAADNTRAAAMMNAGRQAYFK